MNRQALIDLRDEVREGGWPVNTARTVSGALERLTESEWGDLYYRAYEAYCGSLDAAKTLHEAVLPGWSVASIRQCDDEDEKHGVCRSKDWFVRLLSSDFKCVTWVAGEVTKTDTINGSSVDSSAMNPARAWLLAIIEALIQGRGNDDL